MKAKLGLLFISLFILLDVALAQSKKMEVLPSDILTISLIDVKDNTASKCVYVDNVKKNKGDIIIGKQEIQWALNDNVNYIEAINKRTGKKVSFSAKNYTPDTPSLYSIYLKIVRTGTKGSNKDEAVRDMEEWLSQTFYILHDYLIIASPLVIDNNHTFILEPLDTQGEAFKLWHDPKEPFIMYIPKANIKSFPCTFRVTYVDKGKTLHITDSFRVDKYK